MSLLEEHSVSCLLSPRRFSCSAWLLFHSFPQVYILFESANNPMIFIWCKWFFFKFQLSPCQQMNNVYNVHLMYNQMKKDVYIVFYKTGGIWIFFFFLGREWKKQKYLFRIGPSFFPESKETNPWTFCENRQCWVKVLNSVDSVRILWGKFSNKTLSPFIPRFWEILRICGEESRSVLDEKFAVSLCPSQVT